MKQTSVEFLEKELNELLVLFSDKWEKVNKAIEQAKEMEKEQSDDYAIEFAKFISNEDYDLDYWVNNSDIKTLLEIFKKIRYANNKI